MKKTFFSVTPALNTVGGAEIYLREFISFLLTDDEIEKVTVAYPRLPVLEDFFGKLDSKKLEIVGYGFGKLTIDKDLLNPRVYVLLRNERKLLWKMLIDGDYDLMLAHSSTDLFILKDFIEKTSVIFYSDMPAYAGFFPFRTFLSNYLGKVGKIVCVSDFIRERVKKVLRREDGLFTVHNGVERTERKGNRPSEIRKIGIVARLEKEKNVMLGIRVFEKLARRNERLSLHIFGDGSQRKALEKAVGKRGLKGITFHGFVHDADEIYSDVDLLLVPSSTEALSLVILEAMSRGIPVVASGVGGIPEIVRDGYNGFLARPDVGSFYEKVTMLLENPALTETFSKNYPETLQRFSLKEKLGDLRRILLF